MVIDWTGYTIGYFGRPFETRKLKELDNEEKDFLRFELGAGTMIPALEETLLGMSEGGVRQLVVPPQLGYPSDDPSHERVGPKPSTFSGQVRRNVFFSRFQGTHTLPYTSLAVPRSVRSTLYFRTLS